MDEEYISREGIVLEVKPGRLVVRVIREAGECSTCAACAVKGLCRGKDAGQMELSVPLPSGNEAAHHPGDKVVVEYRSGNAAVAAAALFIPTLAGLVGGGFVANALLGGGDGMFIGGAAAGAGLGVLATFLLNRLIGGFGPAVRLSAGGMAARPEGEGEKM